MWQKVSRSTFRVISDLRPYAAKVRYRLYSGIFQESGRGGSIGSHFRMPGDLKVTLGHKVALRDRVFFGGNGRLVIGDHTVVNANCIITSMESIRIGSNVMLAPGVYVLDVDHRFDLRDSPISDQGYDVQPVSIGDGVWVGAGAVITKGVTIGEGAIVGANSVVTNDIPPFAIAAGVPATIIGERPQ